MVEIERRKQNGAEIDEEKPASARHMIVDGNNMKLPRSKKSQRRHKHWKAMTTTEQRHSSPHNEDMELRPTQNAT